MREIQASEAKTHLPALLHDVERGETIIITRHGKRIARMIPEKLGHDREAMERAMASMDSRREAIAAHWQKEGIKPLSEEEIIAMKHEGHRF